MGCIRLARPGMMADGTIIVLYGDDRALGPE
jgi:hypothetical protein